MKITGPLDLLDIQNSLEEERKVLLESIQKVELESPSNDSINPGRSDLAWRYERRQRNLLLLEREKELLSDVEAALQRLENNTYGVCLCCDQPIHLDRLRALPSAPFCVSCQKLQT